MIFKEGQPIYVQIAERISDEILAGTYAADTRVPGVREYSCLLEVNVNTAAKAFDLLLRRGVLYNRRGLGTFVTPEARQLIGDMRRREFVESELPDLFRRMQLLGIAFEEVSRAHADWLAGNGERSGTEKEAQGKG